MRRIGVVMSSPPGYSETFFWTWIQSLSKHYEFIIYASDKLKGPINLKTVTYLNQIGRFYLLFRVLNDPVRNLRLFYKLFHVYGVPLKRLIHDLNILTVKVDILHFYFGNLLHNREKYGLCLNVKSTISFKGSDWWVYPKVHNLDYRRILSDITKIQAESEQIRENVLCGSSFRTETINPVVPEFFRNFTSKLNIEMLDCSDDVKFISVGRLHWVKNYPMILQAFSQLNREGYKFQYTIVGNGKSLEEITYLIHRLGLINRTTILDTKIQHKDIPSVLYGNDVFINFSWSEGYPNGVIEGQVMGLPAIVSPISGNIDIIRNGHNGFVCDRITASNLAESIRNILMLSNRELNEMKLRTKKESHRYCDMQSYTTAWRDFFNNV